MTERAPIEFPEPGEPWVPTPEFAQRCAAQGITLDSGDPERFGRFLAVLSAANEVVNLTRITNPADAWERHIFDALTLLPLMAEATPSGDRLSLVDVGAGGGVPGLVLALAQPDADFTLIEPVGKKAVFLEDAANTLQLRNVRVVRGRAEQFARDRHDGRERFDVSMCRALGRLPLAAELTAPLVRPSGFCLFIKGAQANDEAREAEPLFEPLRLNLLDILSTPTGRIIACERTGRISRRFPRRGRSLGDPSV